MGIGMGNWEFGAQVTSVPRAQGFKEMKAQGKGMSLQGFGKGQTEMGKGYEGLGSEIEVLIRF